MRIRKRGAIAVIDTIVAFGLLLVDSWGRESQIAGLIPSRLLPYLPTAYGVCFLIALLLIRSEYASADYDFWRDPTTEYLFEQAEDGHYDTTETHRVSVCNFGHAPIMVSVLLRAIIPEPVGLAGKLGMPLMRMGEPPSSAPVTINPGQHWAFNLASYRSDPQYNFDDGIYLWHDWSTAPKRLPEANEYIFHLVATASEGQPKAAQYRMFRDNDAANLSRRYRLSRIETPTLWRRLIRLLRLPRRVVSSADASPRLHT
jgi:hypothetical protein